MWHIEQLMYQVFKHYCVISHDLQSNVSLMLSPSLYKWGHHGRKCQVSGPKPTGSKWQSLGSPDSCGFLKSTNHFAQKPYPWNTSPASTSLKKAPRGRQWCAKCMWSSRTPHWGSGDGGEDLSELTCYPSTTHLATGASALIQLPWAVIQSTHHRQIKEPVALVSLWQKGPQSHLWLPLEVAQPHRNLNQLV
jgi:hypothetical protein